MAGLISQVRKTGTPRPERPRGKHRGWRRRPVRARDLLLWFALADLLLFAACVILGIAHGLGVFMQPATPPPPAAHAGDSMVPVAQVVQQLPPARPLVIRVTSVSSGTSYTVAAGDTLSGIAGKACGDPGDWPGIWHANQAEVPDPDLIYPGQVLRFTCGELAAVPQPAVRPAPPAPPAGIVAGVSGGILSCAGLEALWQQAGGAPGEAFMAAEIAKAESGGNPDAVSPSDDIGLWQINKPTWGSLATFDELANARAAVQISHGGADWSPWVTFQRGLYQGQC